MRALDWVGTDPPVRVSCCPWTEEGAGRGQALATGTSQNPLGLRDFDLEQRYSWFTILIQFSMYFFMIVLAKIFYK